VAPVRKWGILLLIAPVHYHTWQTLVVVSAPGYLSFTNSAMSGTLGPSVIELEDVKLTPLPQ